jgi:two-component sensor histidine kinase
VERQAAGILRLLVQDDGIGLPEQLNLRRSGSLGLELVNTLVRQLRGTLDVKRVPATFEIYFKLQG